MTWSERRALKFMFWTILAKKSWTDRYRHRGKGLPKESLKANNRRAGPRVVNTGSATAGLDSESKTHHQGRAASGDFAANDRPIKSVHKSPELASAHETA